MANTWIATPLENDDRLAMFRSNDFDPYDLFERFGSVAIYDLTDELRPIGYVTGDSTQVRFSRFDTADASEHYRNEGYL